VASIRSVLSIILSILLEQLTGGGYVHQVLLGIALVHKGLLVLVDH